MKKIDLNVGILFLVISCIGVACGKVKVNRSNAVTSVKLSQTTALMTVGDTLMLTATVLPEHAVNKAVMWRSSNSTVATVVDGEIIARNVSSAVVTAITEDGYKTSDCDITIIENAQSFLGTVTFASSQTWIVGLQEWSDAVQTTICSDKTNFNGISPNGYKAACRSNPGKKGDVFSWEMLNLYEKSLCPSPWRIPTQDDFVALDKALGGTGNYQSDVALRDNYLNQWGGTYTGFCDPNGELKEQHTHAGYWSRSENQLDPYFSPCLYFNSNGNIGPFHNAYKNNGYALRCVK